MKTSYLFPYRFKLVSGVLFVVSFVLLLLLFLTDSADFDIKTKVYAIVGDSGFSSESLFGDDVFFNWIENSITDEILMLLVIPFGIIFAFSKEKQEDEMVASLRLSSLAWATIVNYVIVLLGYTFVYGFKFLNVMMVAMISQLLIFIVLFRFKMYRFNKFASHEE